MRKPTERFSETVNHYLKYRPAYPTQVLTLLKKALSFSPQTVIADIGSGTGLLTKLFLDAGNTVYGVEPNQGMREAGEEYLKNYPQFYSVPGSAEQTTLPDHSVDMITVGTAFHWFDANKCKIEFKRILKSPGWLVLIWNVRDVENSSIVHDYEKLIRQFSMDYLQSSAAQFSNSEKFNENDLRAFFQPYDVQVASFKNVQHYPWESFLGRLLSSSFVIRADHKNYQDMVNALRRIFDRYQKNGKVHFLYATKVYYGQFV